MAFRDVGEGSNIKQIGRPRPIMRKRIPFYTKVDIRDAMEAYHKASENRWDVQNQPQLVRSVAKLIHKRLSKVSQFKGRSELAFLKRVGNVEDMEAALDKIWLYAEHRRVLLIA